MNGVIVIDKPEGMTSFGVVSQVRRVTGTKKVGHGGTLDPLATGVLPLCLNEATKISQLFLDDDKEYSAVFRLGLETDTLDREGTVLKERPLEFGVETVESVLPEFVGSIEQTVPRYSAVKVKGKPLYRWAREGVEMDLPSRVVNIYDLSVEEILLPYVRVKISCSKGTYIRSLCADVGKRLGCGAMLFGLRRIRSGRFSLKDAVNLEGLDEAEQRNLIVDRFIPLCRALDKFSSITVDDSNARRIRSGIQPQVSMIRPNNISSLDCGDMVVFTTYSGEIIAAARMLVKGRDVPSLPEGNQAAKIIRVFN